MRPRKGSNAGGNTASKPTLLTPRGTPRRAIPSTLGGVTIRVEPAAPADIPELARVLARAFISDPMVVWPMVTDDDLAARVERLFELVDTLYAAEGWIYRAADGLGAMSLIPPDGNARQTAIDGQVARAMAALTPDGGKRYERFWEWIDRRHPPGRLWLLDQLAVEPGAQGRGIGSALLRFALDRAAADGLPLLLETGAARNVAFYESFRFRVLVEGDAPGGGPHVWFLRWDPRPIGAAGRDAQMAPPDELEGVEERLPTK